MFSVPYWPCRAPSWRAAQARDVHSLGERARQGERAARPKGAWRATSAARTSEWDDFRWLNVPIKGAYQAAIKSTKVHLLHPASRLAPGGQVVLVGLRCLPCATSEKSVLMLLVPLNRMSYATSWEFPDICNYH